MRYTFGGYTLDTQQYELRHVGIPLKLPPKVFDLLTYLVQHHDRMVSRQELFDALWPEHFVSEDALDWTVAAARRAVGDSGQAQQVIKTFRGRGYRFVAPLAEHHQALPNDASLPAPAPALATEDSPAVAPPVGGERKQVTVLACALSAVLTQAAGIEPERLHTLRQHVFALVQQEVQRYAGTLQHFVDDTCVAFFGAPVAQEDHARRAVLAALRLQAALRHAGTVLMPGTERGQAVCLSLHTGEAIVGPIGADPRQLALAVGDTTQMADHLLRLAEPGAIVLSAATARLVHNFFRLALVMPVNAPGVTVPPTVYRVLGLAAHHAVLEWQGQRLLRQFVGRTREMNTLHALLAQVEDGHGQVVGIAGEPGIGKSRFLYEFRQRVRHRPFTFLAGRGVSYGQATPYLPLLDLLRQACGLTDRDTPDETAAKVAQSLQDIGMQAPAWAPYVLRLLGREDAAAPLPPLSPQALRTRTFEALLQMQLHASDQRPLLLEVEDVHWIDPTSEEWLLALVERLAGAPILLLLSYRSGYQPAWIGKSYATQLALQRLTAHESQRVVRTVLAPQAVPDGLVRTIVARGQGNPFFLEELAQAVVEQEGQQPRLVMPETVQAVLAARLDRLPPEPKALLQVAAVIGPEVPGALLQIVTACPEATLRHHLADLQGAELLYATRPEPEPVYAFKHALTQEVAYQALLKSTRQQYHQRIAEVLEAIFPETAKTQPELLAHHYTEAELPWQAVAYWQQAAQRAASRSAHVEAIAHCTRGLAVLQTLPKTTDRARCELVLQMTLGPSLFATRPTNVPETGQALTRALALSEYLGDVNQMCKAFGGLFAFHGSRGEFRHCRELGARYLALAQRQRDAYLVARVHEGLGFASFFGGELVTARAHYTQGLALYDAQRDRDRALLGVHDFVVMTHTYLSWLLALLGYPDQGLVHSGIALQRAQELGHPYSLVHAWVHAGMVHELRRDVQAVYAHAETVSALSEEQEFARWSAWGLFFRGWALAAQGHQAIGIAQMLHAVADRQGLVFTYKRALLAEAYVQAGQHGAGWAILREVLAEVENSEGRFYTAELYRLKGEFLFRQALTQAPQAEACFQQALDSARHQQAKWWELRAATSLARLWQHQGKRQAAYDLLAPVYHWFTEGLDTPDLQEAQALLQQLAAP